MRVIICGGRDYKDSDAVLDAMAELPRTATVIHGDAPGADTMVAAAARVLGLKVEAYPADWQSYGRPAGPIRNAKMLDSGADRVIAFPGGRGTFNMVEQARRRGVPVEFRP